MNNDIITDPVNESQVQGVIPALDNKNTSLYAQNYIMPQGEKKPSREYSLKENIFAWICYFMAYIFCLSIPISYNPLGAFIVIVLMFSVTFAFLKKGRKLKAMPVIFALSALLISVCLITTSSDFMHFFAFVYSMLAYCYFLYGMTGDKVFRFTDSIVIDFVKAVFVLPFQSFSDMFKAMFSGKSNKSGQFMLKLLVGIVIALVPTAIVFSLLSYDSNFTNLLSNIFSFNFDSVFTHVTSLVFATAVGSYIYGLFISSSDNKCEDLLTVESCKKSMSNMRIAPVVTMLTAVLPILFIYVVFFISQWDYYISGFTGVLPKNFSYAQYAREGFFQLCVVSVINLVIIVLVSLFIKRKSDKPTMVLKVISVVFSLCTLVLIATAVSKMVMYIDCYGLTPKRVYASWFMLVLSLVFVLIILKQFVVKIKVVALSLAILVVMFGVLALSGVDGYIAKYNTDRYLDGTFDTIDIDAMEDLGDCAVPYMVKVYDVLNEKIDAKIHNGSEYELSLDIKSYLEYYIELEKWQEEDGENDIWSFTIPSLKAQKALSDTKLQ